MQGLLIVVKVRVFEFESVRQPHLKVNGGVTLVYDEDGRLGWAICNPVDPFDIIDGRNIAMLRYHEYPTHIGQVSPSEEKLDHRLWIEAATVFMDHAGYGYKRDVYVAHPESGPHCGYGFDWAGLGLPDNVFVRRPVWDVLFAPFR
jgi:hypothetical protein